VIASKWRDWGAAALLFLSVFGLYLVLSPLTTGGQGYIGEEIDSGMKMLEVFNAWVKGRTVPPMVWSRHGPIPVFFDLPFIKLGKLLATPDIMMSLSPIFFTAALSTLLFVWLRKLTSPGMSLLLTMAGAFGTMLWPYAYIGLETKQSFFVFLAAFLGLANGRIRTTGKLALWALVCGLAVSMKSTGLLFAPAMAYLFYTQFRGEWLARSRQLLIVLLVAGGALLAGDISRNLYWGSFGGGYSSLRGWFADSLLQYFVNAVGIVGSPTKGLIVFAPVLLLSLYVLPRAWRMQRDIVAYTLLIACAMIGFLSTLRITADEVWGPRYMHVAIAPLVLCIGCVWSRFNYRRHLPLVALAMIGVVISFLGAFYYYGVRGFAMTEGGQNTMEWINGDPAWNEITFNARSFALWRKGCPSTPWTPTHVWVWEPPAGAVAWKSIDLRNYCETQSALLKSWNSSNEWAGFAIRVCLSGLVVGVLSMAALLWQTFRQQKGLRKDEEIGAHLTISHGSNVGPE